MGRAPCCDKANVKRGPWSPEEDAILKNYVQQHGTGGNWIALPHKAGLRRCGKSCRLRWLNYLRPDIKHGGFSEEEDNVICSLYSSIGSRWSIIAAQLPGRTDNDIKNYWNTRLKKKLLGKCKDQRTTRRLSPATTKQLESALSASASPANSSVSLTAHDDRISSTAASTLPYATLDHGGIVPLVNLEQSSSPVSKISAPGFANAQERSNYLKEMYSFGYSTLRNMLLRPEIAAIVGDDYSSTNNIDYLMTSPISTTNNVSIGQISPFALDIPAGQQHEDPQDLYGRYAIEVKTEPSQPVPGVASLTDQNESSASPMALWESCCSSTGRNNYIDSAWLNGLSSLEDPHAARTSCLGCGSLTPTELNQMYCDTSLMQPKDEPTNCYSLYNGVVRNAGTAYCNVSEPKSTATFCPNYSDNYIFPASSDEVVSSQGIFQEAEIIY